MSTPAQETGTKAMRIRNTAVRMLIERHQGEFDELLGDAREAAGLPRDPDAAKKEARIEALREKLRALGFEGEV